VLMLRVLRLLRLVRVVRLVKVCRPVWHLVAGLRKCLSTMMSACLLLFLVIYMFACFGAELITKQYRGDAEVGAVVATHFSSLPKIIMTLFQFVSMDGASDIYGPLVSRNPLLVVYFLLLVVVVSFALMNLMTAVVVDGALTSTVQKDQAIMKHYSRMRLKAVNPALKELFRKIDSRGNRNGFVEVRELKQAVEMGIEMPAVIRDMVMHGRLLDIFDLFEANDDDGLTEEEFVGGFSCLTLGDVPSDTMHLLHVLRGIKREVMSLSKGPKEVEQDGAEGGAQCRAPLDILAQDQDEVFTL